MLQWSIVLGMSRVAFHPGRAGEMLISHKPAAPTSAPLGSCGEGKVHVGVSCGVIPAFPLCLC